MTYSKDNDSLDDGLTDDERQSVNAMIMKDISPQNPNEQLAPYNSETQNDFNSE